MPPSGSEEVESNPITPPTRARQVLWCALAATGSVLLLAVTNHITTNVAAVMKGPLPATIYDEAKRRLSDARAVLSVS